MLQKLLGGLVMANNEVEEELEMEDDFDLGDEIEFDFITIDGQEVEVDIEEIEEGDVMPGNYLLLEGLQMLQQVVGIVPEDADLMVVPAYAHKKGKLTLVDYVELTSDNVSRMQILGLKVSLIRKNKEPILFDKAEDFVAIVKTVREEDRHDYELADVSGKLVWVEGGQVPEAI